MPNFYAAADVATLNYLLSMLPTTIGLGLASGLVVALLNRAINGGGGRG